MTVRPPVAREDVATVAIVVVVAAVVARLLVGGVPWWFVPVIAVVGGVVGVAVLLVVPVDSSTAVEEPPPATAPFAPPLQTLTRTATVEADERVRSAVPAPPRRVATPEARTGVRRQGPWSLLESPKVGNDPSMNEDAVAVSADGRSVAIADGASSAFASGLWARLLAEEGVRPGVDLTRSDQRIGLVDRCAARWLIETEGAEHWWAEEARSRGSFAAVAALRLNGRRRWSAVAKGDSCVIVLDEGDAVVSSFPIDDTSQFGLTPDLVSVLDPSADGWRRCDGQIVPGGRVVLATDGFAEWLLRDPRHAQWWWGLDAARWPAELDALRSAGDMVNDDVAIASLDSKALR